MISTTYRVRLTVGTMPRTRYEATVTAESATAAVAKAYKRAVAEYGASAVHDLEHCEVVK